MNTTTHFRTKAALEARLDAALAAEHSFDAPYLKKIESFAMQGRSISDIVTRWELAAAMADIASGGRSSLDFLTRDEKKRVASAR